MPMLCAQKHLFFAILILVARPLFSMDNPQQPSHTTQQTFPSFVFKAPHSARGIPLQLHFDTAAENVSEEQKPEEPARKRLRVEQSSQQQAAPLVTAFEEPYTLSQIFRRLHRPEFKQFERVSKTCATASHLRPTSKKLIAGQLLESQHTPILYVLTKAQGQETVLIDGATYNTKKLVEELSVKTSLLDEAIVDFENVPNYSPSTDKERVPVCREIEQSLSGDELELLKAVKYCEIDYNEDVTEQQVVDQVRALADGNCVLAVKLSHPMGTGEAQITRSLIDKIATIEKLTQCSIVSLTCTQEQFPEGLACLAPLKHLRCLSIEQCELPEDAVLPNELCNGLPLLTVLRVIESGLTGLCPSIGTLQHLRVLEFDEEFIEIPAELHNLKKLKIFSLLQEGPLPPAAIECLPPMDEMKHLDLPCMGLKSNPILESSAMEQLQFLTLRETVEPLIQHPEKFKTLTSLRLDISYPEFEFPLCIANLPSLRMLRGSVRDDSIISYQTLRSIAKNVRHCSLFTENTDAIDEIKKIADLWQFIQINADVINSKLKTYQNNFWLAHYDEIGAFGLLNHQTITVLDLQLLVADEASSVDDCDVFLRSLIDNTFKSGLDESKAIIKRLNQHDKKFASTISQIANAVCSNIPACECSSSCQKLSESIAEMVYDLASAANAVMKDIINGITIRDEQLNNCFRQLRLYARTKNCVNYCQQLLVDLFFHHAVQCNNITNAQFMFTKYNAQINTPLLTNGDTPLHTAIRNRETAQDETVKQQIDHLICFLIKNGANTEAQNGSQQTPLDLISSNSSLRQKIREWSSQ